MQAVLLAGGKGTRLRPLTEDLPKPLVPLGDTPLVEILLRQLRAHGVTEVVIATGHLAHAIQERLGDGSRFGLSIEYLVEQAPLDTAGCLGLITPPAEPFFVANGDLLTTLNFSKMAQFHRERGALVTVGVHQQEVRLELGVLEIGEGGELLDYREKPVYHYPVSIGAYRVSPRACEYIQPGERISMPAFILRLRDAGETVLCYREDCYWLDVGHMKAYDEAVEAFRSAPERFLPGEP